MKNLKIYLISLIALICLPGLVLGQIFSRENNSFNSGQVAVYKNSSKSRVKATEAITQNNSLTLESGIGISCNNQVKVSESHYFRYFNLPCHYGINNGFHITEVMVGVDVIYRVPPAGYPITINIYSAPPYGHYPNIPLELEGTATYLADGTESLKHINLPITATIPKGKSMVVEMVYIDDENTLISPGSNELGETAPTYISSTPCGISTPVTMASIGFSNMALVLQVTGNSVSPNMTITLGSPENDYDSKNDIVTVANNGGKIDATNKILGNSDVHYMGGVINLNPGFSVSEGTVFSALAHGCY